MRPQGPPSWPIRDESILAAVQLAYEDGSWGAYRGPHCDTLREILRQYHDCEHAILCSSGTAAVELALRGIKIGPRDEVILAGYDFRGNIQDVLYLGATPVLVDVDPRNATLDPSEIEAAISDTTRAVVVSHLHGGVADMARVMEIAERHRVFVVEDACQMPGAILSGRRAGLWGHAGVLSFGGSKLLSAGRGGAVLTDSSEIAQRIKVSTMRGNDTYPLSELQAAVLCPQWERLNERNEARLQNAALLTTALERQPGLEPFANWQVDCRPAYYKFGMHYDSAAFCGLSRSRFSLAMRSEGIAIDPGFDSLHTTHAARRFRAVGKLSHATRAGENVLVLHHPVLLEGPGAIDEVIQAVEKIRHHADALVAN